MALEKSGHIFIADELAVASLLLSFPHGSAGFVIQADRFCATRCNGKQHFRGLVLFGLRQLPDFLNCRFE